jgi:hydrogenase maturation protease
VPFFPEKTLLLAIGNASRGDDGLGWALATALEATARFPGDIALRYQLQVEDAELCAQYDCVIFADAWKTTTGQDCLLEPCPASPQASFTTHALSPGSVLYLCQSIFDRSPEAWLLLMRGSRWELGENLSPQGKKSLTQGLNRLLEKVSQVKNG